MIRPTMSRSFWRDRTRSGKSLSGLCRFVGRLFWPLAVLLCLPAPAALGDEATPTAQLLQVEWRLLNHGFVSALDRAVTVNGVEVNEKNERAIAQLIDASADRLEDFPKLTIEVDRLGEGRLTLPPASILEVSGKNKRQAEIEIEGLPAALVCAPPVGLIDVNDVPLLVNGIAATDKNEEVIWSTLEGGDPLEILVLRGGDRLLLKPQRGEDILRPRLPRRPSPRGSDEAKMRRLLELDSETYARIARILQDEEATYTANISKALREPMGAQSDAILQRLEQDRALRSRERISALLGPAQLKAFKAWYERRDRTAPKPGGKGPGR